jgi:hypothetical protein
VNAVFGEVFPKAVSIAKKLLQDRELRSKNVPIMFISFIALMFAFFIITRFINQRLAGKFLKLDLNEIVDLYLYGIMVDKKEGRA